MKSANGPIRLVVGLGLAAAVAVAAPRASPAAAASSPFDAARLRKGRFLYRIAKGGAEVARFTLTVGRREDGNYLFTGEATGFDQQWESVATPSFEPRSATLRMGKAGSVFTMRLAYADGSVTGSQRTSTAGAAAPEEKPVSARVPPGTVDQRIDWAAMLAGPLEPGRRVAFTVYDPKTGVSAVEGTVGVSGRTTVPAGEFETIELLYRIRKATGTEEYRLHATRRTPRVMVREDFPGGDVTELLELPPSDTTAQAPARSVPRGGFD